jgi:hypothetical protein
MVCMVRGLAVQGCVATGVSPSLYRTHSLDEIQDGFFR